MKCNAAQWKQGWWLNIGVVYQVQRKGVEWVHKKQLIKQNAVVAKSKPMKLFMECHVWLGKEGWDPFVYHKIDFDFSSTTTYMVVCL